MGSISKSTLIRAIQDRTIANWDTAFPQLDLTDWPLIDDLNAHQLPIRAPQLLVHYDLLRFARRNFTSFNDDQVLKLILKRSRILVITIISSPDEIQTNLMTRLQQMNNELTNGSGTKKLQWRTRDARKASHVLKNAHATAGIYDSWFETIARLDSACSILAHKAYSTIAITSPHQSVTIQLPEKTIRPSTGMVTWV